MQLTQVTVLYVAESTPKFNDNNTSSGVSPSTTPSSLIFFLSEQQECRLPHVRIFKADISGNNDIDVNQTLDSNSGGGINEDNSNRIINNALNWPVIDMEFDDGSGFLYAFHDYTTISRINTTSGEREDIIAA